MLIPSFRYRLNRFLFPKFWRIIRMRCHLCGERDYWRDPRTKLCCICRQEMRDILREEVDIQETRFDQNNTIIS